MQVHQIGFQFVRGKHNFPTVVSGTSPAQDGLQRPDTPDAVNLFDLQVVDGSQVPDVLGNGVGGGLEFLHSGAAQEQTIQAGSAATMAKPALLAPNELDEFFGLLFITW